MNFKPFEFQFGVTNEVVAQHILNDAVELINELQDLEPIQHEADFRKIFICTERLESLKTWLKTLAEKKENNHGEKETKQTEGV